MSIELRHLRGLLAVIDTGTFTAAAAALNMTQPALSRSIRQLETLLDVQLLQRTTRSVTPTAEGIALATDVRRVLGDLDAVLAAARPTSTLRLGFSWLLPDPWATEAIGRYEETGADVTLHRVDDPIAALHAGTIDAAIVRETTGNREITVEPLFTERRVAALSTRSSLTQQESVTWQELSTLPLVVNTLTGTTGPDSWEDADPDRPVITCANFDEWLELVAAGRGIGVVPDVATRRIQHDRISFLTITDAPPSSVGLAYRGTSTTAIRTFLNATTKTTR